METWILNEIFLTKILLEKTLKLTPNPRDMHAQKYKGENIARYTGMLAAYNATLETLNN